jgi:hypothetical protein
MATKTVKRTAAKKAPVKTGVRRVALVGVNPARVSRNLAAPKPKKREVWPRFMVSEFQGKGPWMPRAAFHKIEDAEEYARAIHAADSSIGVKVEDTKS